SRDWSSDVCSSDLCRSRRLASGLKLAHRTHKEKRRGLLPAVPNFLVVETQLRADGNLFVAVRSDHADHARDDHQGQDPGPATTESLGISNRRSGTSIADGDRRSSSGSRTEHDPRRCESGKRFTSNHLVPFHSFPPVQYSRRILTSTLGPASPSGLPFGTSPPEGHTGSTH